MKFGYTILYVDSVAETMEFYGRAFGLEKKMLHESGDYGELETGATRLSFASLALIGDGGFSPARPSAEKPSFEIALVTDDVQSAVANAVDAGARLIKEPEQKPWGQTVAYVADNNGFLIELCTPVGGG